MAVTTQTEIAGPVNVVFQKSLLLRAQALCPYFIGTVPAEIRQHSGTFTAKWRRYEHLTPITTALTEIQGSVAFPTRNAVQPTVTDITATVSKYGNFIFLNEEVDLININNVAMELSDVLGENAGRSLNRLQRNIMEDNATAFLAGTATTATGLGATTLGGADLDRGVIAAVFNALKRQDSMPFSPETRGSQNIGTAPIRESYWGICHVDTTEDLRGLTGFNSVETYAGQTETARGEIGHVGGVRFIETTEATIDAGTGATVTSTATAAQRHDGTTFRSDVYNTVIYGREAVGSLGLDTTHVKSIYRPEDRLPAVQMISHARGSAGAADPLNELSSVGWKSWHTGQILNSNWIRVARHVVSNLEQS
jgi:N4-gp56 family major capsid protein